VKVYQRHRCQRHIHQRMQVANESHGLIAFFGAVIFMFCAYTLIPSPLSAQESSLPNPATIQFNRDIRPLLSDRCFACHGPDANHRQAELRLDIAPDAATPEQNIIVAQQPEASELVVRIDSQDPSSMMPPPDSGKELSLAERELLKSWIRQGAHYESHWSWAPLVRPTTPNVEPTNKSATRSNPIDVFIAASAGELANADYPQADPYTILRRLSFDLTGLPPDAADLDWLGQQLDPQAARLSTDSIDWDFLIDRKLASPAFGERMAVWWLDLVRYADTVGYHGDQVHHAAPYRDWVIRAFNDNLPFHTFSEMQLAGDLLPETGESGKIASAYNRLLQTSHEGGVQQKEYLAKYSADRVRNFSQVWLGLTIGCAECHDHKFDPITQREFYELAAFFADIDEIQTFKGGDTSPTKRFPEMDVLSPLDGSTPMRVMVSNSVEPRVIRVLPRGNWLDESGDIVTSKVPSTLPAMVDQSSKGTRLELARWLFEQNQALTSRVTVNRMWTLFFGRGLSSSLDDYGSQGVPPTHPELLDWLASEWIDSNWDIKHLVRLMVQTEAYRRATLTGSAATADSKRGIDPENRHFLVQSPRRIPAEFIRDSVLEISGLMDHKRGGPSVYPYQPDGYYQHLNFPSRNYVASESGNQYRRGLYTHWQRQFLHPMLKSFDAPSREECTAQRNLSNTPTQMLVLLNDTTFIEAARSLAWRVWRNTDPAIENRDAHIARSLWRLAFSRPSTAQENTILVGLYQQQLTYFREHPQEMAEFLEIGQWKIPDHESLDGESCCEIAAWSFAGRSLLMLNESITLY
jgi:hypothetical protein